MMLPTNGKNVVKIAEGICPCGAFICQNFGKIFSFGASHPHPSTDYGEIFRGGVHLQLTHPCQISPELV